MFLVADDSTQDSDQLYTSIAADSQITDRWQSTIRFGTTGQTTHYVNPTPSGTPFDPFGFGANYLGNTVTLTGANDATVTGRAILDFGGDYPSTFDSRTTRGALSGQTTFQATPELAISGGARWDKETGYDDPDGDPTAERNNGGAFVEARATVMNRAYLSGGVGVEHNAVFGTEAVPRFSAAVYLRNPSAEDVGDTKVSFNIGRGIKAPSVFQEQNAVFELVQGTPAAANISPVGPERSRGWDVALEQGFGGGAYRARIRVLQQPFRGSARVPESNRPHSRGCAPQRRGGDGIRRIHQLAIVRRAGCGTVRRCCHRPRPSGSVRRTPISTPKSPRRSARARSPIRRSPACRSARSHRSSASGRSGVRPTRARCSSATTRGPPAIALSAYFAGKRDDSTFLSDEFFGNSMLLPNQDLDPAYQKIDLSVSYRVHRQAQIFTSIENLFDKEYEAAFGFPSLPFSIRAGVNVTFGGDR